MHSLLVAGGPPRPVAVFFSSLMSR
jgi:hypothetical protein